MWIFGYGSLIWRPGFPFLERQPARLYGWQRRFWQGSHDHRGEPHRPGRVVTLVETGDGHCDGVVYRVDQATAEQIFAALDHREKNGYERHEVSVELRPGAIRGVGAIPGVGANSCSRFPEKNRGLESAPTGVSVSAVVYIAATGNHAYLGPAPIAQMARQIAVSTGPSGANRDYLLELAAALQSLGADDPHVFELEAAVRACSP